MSKLAIKMGMDMFFIEFSFLFRIFD